MTLELGDVIQGKYRIVRLLGQGGMGAVYEGENTLIARRVAIKVLFGAVANQQGVVERFEREAQAAGRIGNDHILEVLDMGTLQDGNRFMVMEYLDGETLGERSKRLGPLSPDQLYPLARQLLKGLAAAHDAGIIHRDLKPDNVFILKEKAGQPDFVKIIDFGISKFTALDQDMKMTATGAVMGTPYFMSPEQAKGSGSADARSDVYAVGVILYKAVTGQVPFDGATFNELLFKIVLSPMPQPRALVPELDPAFESIIQKAMARDPARRFQSAAEFAKALDAWRTHGTAVTVPPPEETGLGTASVVGSSSADANQAAALAATGLSDIGAAPALNGGETKGTWTQSEVQLPTKKGGAGLLIGLGAAAAAVIAVGAVVMFTGSEPSTAEGTEAAVTSEAPAAQPPPIVEPEPATGPEVKPIEQEQEQAQAGSQESDEVTAQDSTGAPTSTAAVSRPEPTAAVSAPAAKPVPAPRPRTALPRPKPKPVKKKAPDFGY